MNDLYAPIKTELELTRTELEDGLNRTSYFDREKLIQVGHHIQAELQDVKRTLLKMELGLYGICEETGERIPYELLMVVPTVRTLREAEAMTQFPYLVEQPLYC
ncbi:MAG TPA: molecular chaperone DnaK [Bacillales bacterium]|nr:molecular chaperone DnaK [Bacillales bacterium]